jgi:hypothetical protein
LSYECGVIKADHDTESFREFGELEVDLVYRAQEGDIVRRREEHDASTKDM